MNESRILENYRHNFVLNKLTQCKNLFLLIIANSTSFDSIEIKNPFTKICKYFPISKFTKFVINATVARSEFNTKIIFF